MNEYTPENDPDWQYQGRSRRQVAANQRAGMIAIYALGAFLLIVFGYYTAPGFFLLLGK